MIHEDYPPHVSPKLRDIDVENPPIFRGRFSPEMPWIQPQCQGMDAKNAAVMDFLWSTTEDQVFLAI